jgi:hypothetical protein
LKKYILVISILIITVAAIILINEWIKNKINNGENISYKIIGLTEAKQKYDEGKYLFIDARAEVFYKNGHIKSAIKRESPGLRPRSSMKVFGRETQKIPKRPYISSGKCGKRSRLTRLSYSL